MMKKRVLIVEDDRVLAKVLRDNLVAEGFEVQRAGTGAQARNSMAASAPDLILLDLMLPDEDGFALCRAWRSESPVPIIVLSARSQRVDKLQGLRLGADDYLTKPFDLEELIARIRSVLRRSAPGVDRLTLGAVQIDFVHLRAWHGERPIDLTHREFELLRYLAERSDTIVHRDELLRQVWRYPITLRTRAVDHAISRLRRKIEADAHHPRFIHTVHGDGYRLVADVRGAA
ncbi:MAG: response regulator transcription factor [Acidimicrobiia bacterium]|nr:response regulator transcription factor [Acidimicrobiia bacterium]